MTEIHDPSDYGFTSILEANWKTFRREVDRIPADAYTLWPIAGAFEGTWLVYPLVLSKYTKDFPAVDIASHRQRCPESYRILRGIPGLIEAGFSRLEPGTHILPHVDAVDPAELRCHLGLRIPANNLVRIADRVGTWEEGKCRVLDAGKLHEAANLGSEPRTLLICDFRVRPGVDGRGGR